MSCGRMGDKKTSAMVELTHGFMLTTVLSNINEIPSLPSGEKSAVRIKHLV